MELPFLLLLRELSASRIAELRKMPRSFNIKMRNETQVSGRLGMSGACLGVDPLDIRLANENALNNPPCPITPICTSFISWIGYNVFIVLQCHLKDHLCQKVT